MTTVQGEGVVQFRFYRPEASNVRVAGDFNGWQGEALPMQRDQEGWWVAEVRLPPGEYRFRYVADGRWFTDYAAYGVEASPLGYNAVVVVPRKRGRRRDDPPGLAGRD
jgi:1,4-alpha-glucan branching enzyme